MGLGENVHQVVTIASLVERETAVDAERPLVASVFQNRLAQNMPLNTDPTVIYGLELAGHWRGAIYESDLTRDTPYNTYLHTGLPPGPVCNPGIRRRCARPWIRRRRTTFTLWRPELTLRAILCLPQP